MSETEDDEPQGWDQLAELTGGVDPAQVDALKAVRGLEAVYPLLHALVGRSVRDFFVRSAALEALVGADEAVWGPEDLSRALHWLTPSAADSVLKILRQSGWIKFEAGFGTTLTDGGRWAYDVLSFFHRKLRESELLPVVAGIDYALQIGTDPILLLMSMRSRLIALRDELEAARSSYSEVVLRKSIAKLNAALELSNDIRKVLDKIPLDQRAARAVAREIHELVSQLLGKSSELHSAVVQLGRQYLQLSQGLTTEQIVAALMRLTRDELNEVGREALLPVIAAPPLLTTEVVASAAELQVERERHEPKPVEWVEPPPPESATNEVVTPPEVVALLADLSAIAQATNAQPLSEVVPRSGTSTSYLRASLLALVGDDASGEGVAGQLGALPLRTALEKDGWPEPLEEGQPLSALTPGRIRRKADAGE